jgi:hypothetical protein
MFEAMLVSERPEELLAQLSDTELLELSSLIEHTLFRRQRSFENTVVAGAVPPP